MMGYWNSVMGEGEEEEKDSFDLFWIRIICAMLLVAMVSFITGFMSVDYSGNKALERDCVNNYAPSYSNGVIDSVIYDANRFIEDCSPTNVEAFRLISPENGAENGMMLRCTNTTYFPIAYRGVK